MEYRIFKEQGELTRESISLLGFGAMRLPTTDTERDIDYDKAKQMVDEAIKGGVNYFDSAYVYHGGESERFLGEALSDYDRSSYFLATKMPLFDMKTADDAPRYFEKQLERLQTDYIDFYLLHALDSDRLGIIDEFGLYDFLRAQKEAGRIRHIGFSFHDHPGALQDICAGWDWDFAQIQLNYFDWEAYQSKEQYDILEKRGIPCIVMEPVRGGALADLGEEGNKMLKWADPASSVASWAIRYAASLPNVLTVLSGMSTLGQVQDNLATFSPFRPLDADDRRVLGTALEAFRSRFAIPCTGCHYCMPCPSCVTIPKLFSDYNTSATEADMTPFTRKYRLSGASGDKCNDCGRCIPLCPQHLNVPSLIRQVAASTAPKDLVF